MLVVVVLLFLIAFGVCDDVIVVVCVACCFASGSVVTCAVGVGGVDGCGRGVLMMLMLEYRCWMCCYGYCGYAWCYRCRYRCGCGCLCNC